MEKKVGLILLVGFALTAFMFSKLFNDTKDYLIFGDSSSIGSLNDSDELVSYSDLFVDEFYKEVKSSNNSYVIKNLSSRNLYDLIMFNDVIDDNELTCKQLIAQSDIISIFIGLDEIYNNENVSVYLYYMDKVLDEITKINDGEVYLFSLFSLDLNVENVNSSLYDLAKKYGINFLDISEVANLGYLNEEDYLPNYMGQKTIADLFINEYKNVNNYS